MYIKYQSLTVFVSWYCFADFKCNITGAGWGGRIWPKVGCGGDGQNCLFGQSSAPCPSGGCQPPGKNYWLYFIGTICNNLNKEKEQLLFLKYDEYIS